MSVRYRGQAWQEELVERSGYLDRILLMARASLNVLCTAGSLGHWAMTTATSATVAEPLSVRCASLGLRNQGFGIWVVTTITRCGRQICSRHDLLV